jgi:hypothetical protein
MTSLHEIFSLAQIDHTSVGSLTIFKIFFRQKFRRFAPQEPRSAHLPSAPCLHSLVILGCKIYLSFHCNTTGLSDSSSSQRIFNSQRSASNSFDSQIASKGLPSRLPEECL